MQPPRLIPPLRSRTIAILVVVWVVLLQLFAEQTIAKEKKAVKQAAKTFAAKEAAPEPKKVTLPEELLAIEKKYLAAKTLEAEFTQRDEVKLTGAKKESSGVLMIRHPDQFRWETLKPDKNLLVSDGRKFWFYTPPFEAGERGQVIEKKTAEVQSDLANALLAGAFSKIHDVKIEKLSSTKFKLTPAEGVAGTVKTAELEIDPAKNVINKLRLEHAGGNKTEITLGNVKLAGKMADAYFTFVTPPSTDVIRE
ncbi:MAG: outer membrane lipoprotein carrier protein LolA [Bdellovibrionales bacterium]|nr:outer membrane lipoprotein carrier protein LolA [Bdellovibrionales bacterium]